MVNFTILTMKSNKLSIVTLTISIISILLSSYVILSEKRFDADWGFLITGVLSFLVTILITWQIWSMIDTRNAMKEMEHNTKSSELNMSIQYEKLSICVYSTLFDFHRKSYISDIQEIFHYGLLVIAHAKAANEFTQANSMIKFLIECFPVTKSITNFQKSLLINQVNNISSEGLINMDTLRTGIFNLPSKD